MEKVNWKANDDVTLPGLFCRRFKARLKKFLTSGYKINKRLYSDGSGTVSNGHWLVRLPEPCLPSVVDVSEFEFPLREPATLVEGNLSTGEDAGVPEFSRADSAIRNPPVYSARFRRHGSCLVMFRSRGILHYVLDIGVGMEETSQATLDARYVDFVFSLAGIDPDDWVPALIGTNSIDGTMHGLGSVGFWIGAGFRALVMPRVLP